MRAESQHTVSSHLNPSTLCHISSPLTALGNIKKIKSRLQTVLRSGEHPAVFPEQQGGVTTTQVSDTAMTPGLISISLLKPRVHRRASALLCAEPSPEGPRVVGELKADKCPHGTSRSLGVSPWCLSRPRLRPLSPNIESRRGVGGG